MPLNIFITGLEPRMNGDEVIVEVKLSSGENEEQRKLKVASKMLFEIGNIGMGSLPYEISMEDFDTLQYDEKLWEAVKKSIDLLSYGDNTKSALTMKLRKRGFDRYIAEDAAEYAATLGYIDESGMLARAVSQLANVKLYGKSRIKNELFKKGISREILTEELDGLFEEIDFFGNLCRLIRKKCDFDCLSDRKYRESLYAAMYRYGYSPSDTMAAIKTIQEENEE